VQAVLVVLTSSTMWTFYAHMSSRLIILLFVTIIPTTSEGFPLKINIKFGVMRISWLTELNLELWEFHDWQSWRNLRKSTMVCVCVCMLGCLTLKMIRYLQTKYWCSKNLSVQQDAVLLPQDACKYCSGCCSTSFHSSG
jgi:cytochrome bd-type quinol oxidase subunit 2